VSRSLLHVYFVTTAARASFDARFANACACAQIFLAAELTRMAVTLGSQSRKLPGELLLVARLTVILITGLRRFFWATRAAAKRNRFHHLWEEEKAAKNDNAWECRSPSTMLGNLRMQ